ncbi:MAG TPA: cytochrome P450, partial [Aggregatilineales bacterium]|nr:cytochrome P450 [Aggregatilineales bacterium]
MSEAIHWKIGTTTAPLPPKAQGLPILGNALNIKNNPVRYVVEQYQKFGPIFRISLLGNDLTVLVGREAIQFASTPEANEIFSLQESYGGLAIEIGPVILSMEGDQHRHYRKLARPSHSRSQAAPRIPELLKVVDDFIDTLQVGQSVDMLPAIRRMVSTQLGMMMLNQSAGEYFDDFVKFSRYMLFVYQFKMMPKFMLKTPPFKRAKARVLQMVEELVDYHRRVPAGTERPHDALDEVMEAVDAEGSPYSHATLLGTAMGPYIAGMDTASGTINFILYALHKHTYVLDPVRREITDLYAKGIPTSDDFKDLTAFNGAINETMRMYPLVPFLPRTTKAAFEFGGYRVDAGSDLFIATTATHFFPEYYPDPYTFDIRRER